MTHERQDSGIREVYQAIREMCGDGYRELLQVMLEEVTKEEMTAAVGAGVYERTEGMTGYRNGYKLWVLNTRVGGWSYRFRRIGTGKCWFAGTTKTVSNGVV